MNNESKRFFTKSWVKERFTEQIERGFYGNRYTQHQCEDSDVNKPAHDTT